MSTPKPPVLTVNASYVAIAHTVCAYLAFLAALAVGCYLHYHKIVQNAWYGYPDEWFPSVSATIGDRYPERSVFQILIAVTSGPRFLLVFSNFLVLRKGNLVMSWVLLVSGIFRTFTCGGWVYVTSTDDHDWHDISMVAYILLTIPWTLSMSVLSPKGSVVKSGRVWTALAFFGLLVPLVYLFIQHKVHRIPGAYSYYAYVEWGLIFFDVGFDAWSIKDLSALEFRLYSDRVEAVSKEAAEAADARDGAIAAAVSAPPVSASVEKSPSPRPAASGKSDKAVVDFTAFEFFVNTVNAFMFWSVITSLLVCVWYFPLWHMGISGYEAVIAVMFVAPLLLLIPPLRRLLEAYPQIARSLAVLLGLGAYKVEEPESRLVTITAGVGFCVVGFAAELSSTALQPKKNASLWVSLNLGLLATSVLKYACHSNNPAWPIMNKDNGGYNEWAIFAGLAAALFTKSHASGNAQPIPRSGGSFALAVLGLGGYLFSLQAYLSDSSTLVYWSWEGYPVRGPLPLNGGPLHLTAFALGLFASVKIHPNFIATPALGIVAIASSAVLHKYSGWVGFAGSLVWTAYLAALGPLVSQAVSGYNVALVFLLALLVNVIVSLASVWTVAYAFVPGGPLLRERTDIILAVSVVSVLLLSFNYTLRRIGSKIARLEVQGPKLLSLVTSVITILVAVSAATYLHRLPTRPFEPYNPKTRSFNAGIWCVHFGLDNDMWSSETRMRDLIRDAQVDIIGLLETDTERLIGGNRDFTQKIADDLGMYVDYGPGPNKHTWGAALLSKFPILESSHHLLPSPVGELAPAILATLDIYGEKVDVVVFHSGQEEDVEDRRLQSLGVADIMAGLDHPMVLLSYLVTEPLKGNYNTYVSEYTRMHDIDSTDWDRWCEYILFRDLKKVAYARISRSTITDTELQVAKFTFLTDEMKLHGDEFLYGNNYVDEKYVLEEMRMPALLRGDGVRGHHYHVFDEPRYFAAHP